MIAYVVLATIILAMIVGTARGVLDTGHDRRYERAVAQYINNCILAIGLCAWPLIFEYVLQWNDSGAEICNLAYVFSIAWPVALISADLMAVPTGVRGDIADETGRAASIANHANILIASAWAIASLLQIFNTTSHGHSVASAKIFMSSLFLAIAFLVPGTIGSLNTRSYVNICYMTMQRCMMYYAIGLFALGIVVAWQA